MSPHDQYRLLLDSLRLVAAPPEQQLAALPEFVCVTDEVVSTFGDAFLLVPQLERAGLVSAGAAATLKRLDEFFAAMPEDETLAEAQSLKTHEFWIEARGLAARALELLGEERCAPDLSTVKWVQGE